MARCGTGPITLLCAIMVNGGTNNISQCYLIFELFVNLPFVYIFIIPLGFWPQCLVFLASISLIGATFTFLWLLFCSFVPYCFLPVDVAGPARDLFS